MTTQPRAIRNNNPLNIRVGNDWKGERTRPTDPDFEEYQTMEYGCRAALYLLRKYISRGQNTPAKIIARWAPATENNIAAYIKTVSAVTNLQPDTILRPDDKNAVCRLAWGMARVESGREVSFQYFENAWSML